MTIDAPNSFSTATMLWTWL